jgi:hypothetical protein
MASAPIPYYAPRKATKQAANATETKLLSEWRDLPGYVLLGDPGAVKSSCFAVEAAACQGLLIAARDIVDGVAPAPTDQRAIFIDGLDEIRAGVSDPHAPFGQIRKWWSGAGKPTLRLSCREADGLSISDVQGLGGIAVLHLEPLGSGDIQRILDDRCLQVPKPEEFWEQANTFGLT